MLVANLLQNAFNVVDMIFVGRLGPSAVAAVGMCGIIMGFLFVIIMGIAMGTVAMVSRYVGADDRAEAENVAVQSFFLGLIFYFVIAIIVYPLSRPMLGILGAADDVIEHGVTYLRIMFFGSFTMILGFILNSTMRAAGDAATPMKILAASTLINIALDPLLIFGIWFFPKLGVAGSALATVIARGIGLMVILGLLLRGTSVIRLNLKGAKVEFPIMLRVMKIGIFASLQGIIRNFTGMVLTRLVAVNGTFAVAAYVVGLRLQMIVLMPGFALGNALSTLVGQNIGAGKPDRAEKTSWITVAFGAGIMTLLGIIYIIFPVSVIRIFNDHPEVISIGRKLVRIIGGSFGFVGLAIILGRAINGAGDTLSPMIITIIGLLVLRLGLSALFSWKIGIVGIWFGIAVSSVIQGLMITFWFNKGRWKLKEI